MLAILGSDATLKGLAAKGIDGGRATREVAGGVGGRVVENSRESNGQCQDANADAVIQMVQRGIAEI